MEAATTSALGGSLGIALGYLVSLGINQILPLFTASLGVEMSVSPSFDAAAVAFIILGGHRRAVRRSARQTRCTAQSH